MGRAMAKEPQTKITLTELSEWLEDHEDKNHGTVNISSQTVKVLIAYAWREEHGSGGLMVPEP